MTQVVLFDLDGTLADTAPDLGAALNRLRVEEGKPPLPLEQIRPQASNGVRGLLALGFDMTPDLCRQICRLSPRYFKSTSKDEYLTT